MKKMSIKTSILLPTVIVLILGITALVVTVGAVSSSTTNDLTGRLMSARVNEYSNKFNALCMDSYGTVISTAPIVANFSNIENGREDVIHTLADVLMANENMVGIWTCWEPNAFDGKDAEHANSNAYHDATGRFVPYIYKSGSGYEMEALLDYDVPGIGDYYLGARNSGKPYITDPYEYETAGGNVIVVYSIATPIIVNGSVAGVVGIDINLDSIVSVMNAATILDDGYVITISPSGLFATHSNNDLMLKDYKTVWMKSIATDIDKIRTSGGDVSTTAYSDVINANIRFLASGIMIGDTGRYWVVGGIVPDKTATAAATSLVWLVVGIGLALVLVLGLTIFLLIRGRLRKLPVMTEMAGILAKGDTNLPDLDSGTEQTKNEITLLERAFSSMADGIKAQADVMKQIADGDYSMTIPVRSEVDIMNLAINEMIANTNETMSNINSAAGQVSNGSKQIADGAQALAQGATEQSATVEQLSASVIEISEQTKNNAAVAEETRVLEDDIKNNAEQGSEKMEQMMQAVKDISESSQAIGKVIKIIDDIAFQTNILALNAAVEAARAGQHGKGFAVVADEVRNLAAKSAEAAKDTEALIETSIQKSEMGAKISEETARYLNLIVEGILRSSALVSDIARSSGEQTIAISQISEAINQVSQVVQQNSATSEESAAASQEMSGQAELLQQLIAQFKLKDSAYMAGNATSSAHMSIHAPSSVGMSIYAPSEGGGISDPQKY